MIVSNSDPQIVLEIETDPAEVAAARARHERAKRNAAWLNAHAHEVYTRNRGRYVCIAGEEAFAADALEDALAAAKAKHPDDDGSFFFFIPRHKAIRVYAHRG